MISDEFSTNQQGWLREVTTRIGEHKVRVTIYRDSYDFQSLLYVDVWSPTALKWDTIKTLSGMDYKDLPSQHSQESAWRKASQPIIDKLLDYPKEILT